MPERRFPIARCLSIAFGLAFLGGATIGVVERRAEPNGQAAPVAASMAASAAPVLNAALARLASPVADALAPAADVAPADTAPAAPAAQGEELTGTLERGQTLAEALSRKGLSADRIFVVVREMGPMFNFRYSKPGDRFRLVLSPAGDVESFVYERSASERWEIKRNGATFAATRHEPTLVRRQARLAGVVTSSLAAAIEQLGERPGLATDFAEIFAWDVDFTRGAHRGDEFSILYERLFTVDKEGRETYTRPGQILAARYSTGDGDFDAVYFETGPGRGSYYRPDGTPVERQFLKAPLDYSRISSNFAQARLHPILKIWRPHLGIDYAAPAGTSVWSVANGSVIFKGYQGGYGNLVKVRHASGYVSYYAHLARFAPGLRIGQRVSQKQVLGQVGSTGLSTGPHLCFRLTKGDDFVNPTKLHAVAGDPVPRAARDRFKARSGELLAALDPRPLVVTNEAL
ncbi:MAG TPA: peptidoglycan DD-metalloendopeptidase family protein [Myxococcota bacterium]|nr:peptidoglycan DD-metalloendopeptidase family protein [Myxococcota bacterium]